MKKITNKLLWIFAVGQFGWSLLSGIITNWMTFYYTGVPKGPGDNTGLFRESITQGHILWSLTLFGLVMAVGRVFDAVTDPLKREGCDCAVLACTELSLLTSRLGGDSFFVDSLEVLAECAVRMFDKEYIP